MLLSHPADFGESVTDFSLSDGCPGPAYRGWSPNGQLKPRDPYDPSQTRPSDAAQESVRRGARTPPSRHRSLLACAKPGAVRPLPYDGAGLRGFAI